MPGTYDNEEPGRDGRGGLVEKVKSARINWLGRELRTPSAAAIAGIVFSVLLTTSLVFIKLSIPASPAETGRWLAEGGFNDSLLLAFNLIPFAGIAFLWFIAVIRDRLGEREDKFFATVFLGSGLLFVAMLFAATAIAIGLAMSFRSVPTAMADGDLWRFGREAIYAVVYVYAMRMAAVFMISAATLGLRTAVISRWLAFLGYAIAVLLLLAVTFADWIMLLFPLWVFLVSVEFLVKILLERRRTPVEV